MKSDIQFANKPPLIATTGQAGSVPINIPRQHQVCGNDEVHTRTNPNPVGMPHLRINMDKSMQIGK